MPAREFEDGGPGRDGIPAILFPIYRTLSTVTGNELPTSPLDLIMVLEIDGELRGYPEAVLWTHEIINDTFNGRDIVVSYCPLTGSGVIFDRAPNEFFRVSGLLYETNLIMYDDATESLWPQMELEASCGERASEKMRLYPVREMSMGMARELMPDLQIVIGGTERGGAGGYPYGPYDQVGNETLLFRVSEVDRTFPIKSLTLAVESNGVWKGYPHLAFEGDGIVNEDHNGEPIAVFHVAIGRFANAYSRQVDDQVLTFDLVRLDEEARYILVDAETGSVWNLLGEAVEGPLEGKRLRQMMNFNAMWFSFKVSFPTAEVWGI